MLATRMPRPHHRLAHLSLGAGLVILPMAACEGKPQQPAQAAELKKDAYDMSLRENSFNENLPPSVRRDAPR